VAARDEIIAFCDELLDIDSFDDYGPNGLQVPGAPDVTRVVSGVSAHLELLLRARDAGGELVVAHHGLFWDFLPRALSEQMAARLRVALGAGISVAGYHLPLDAHPEIGNNVLLCRGLGFEPRQTPFAKVRGRAIGIVGERSDGIEAGDLVTAVRRLLNREPLVFDHGPRRVRSIGICSGAGASEIHGAVRLGLDAFLTGEPAEHAMADAREGGLHFIAAGHWATETLGIRRLGDLIGERFGVEHEFIAISNPV
jgi:dinuclear metal center YbgI/SA1388 family protein